MRLRSLSFAALAVFLVPALLPAKAFNEAQVEKLNGTIMVEHADKSTSVLQTSSTVQKGDVITVYDKSWVLLKTHWGDRIGLDGGTKVTLDEYFFEGPDRQIRVLLHNGTVLLRTGGASSRQSFFEIDTGSIVTVLSDTESILEYDPAADHLTVKYLDGKIKVIDKTNEQRFAYEQSVHNWVAGVMQEVDPLPADELDIINFKKFFAGDPRIEPGDRNMLLHGSDN